VSSGPEHYKEAEALLAMAEEQRIAAVMADPTAAADPAADVAALTAAAQVHAVLALAAATAGDWASRNSNEVDAYAAEWREAIR
jgi:hypothetical protein